MMHKLGLGPRLAVLRLAMTVALTSGPALADEQASQDARACRAEDCVAIAVWAYDLAESGALEMRGDDAYELALVTCLDS